MKTSRIISSTTLVVFLILVINPSHRDNELIKGRCWFLSKSEQTFCNWHSEDSHHFQLTLCLNDSCYPSGEQYQPLPYQHWQPLFQGTARTSVSFPGKHQVEVHMRLEYELEHHLPRPQQSVLKCHHLLGKPKLIWDLCLPQYKVLRH